MWSAPGVTGSARFVDELAKKSAAGVAIALEVIEGETLVKEAASRQSGAVGEALTRALTALAKADEAGKARHASVAGTGAVDAGGR